METPVKLTLSQAAKSLGKSKGTLSKALNSGAISGTKADDGSWQIDQSELMRWVSSTSPRERLQDRLEPPEHPAETPNQAAVDRDAQMALMRERLDDATATVADLRERLDASEAERRALNQRLLTAPPPSEATPQEPHSGPEKPQNRRRRMFGWFRR